jgi:alkanesulfonate monooxygenase SsuD/methylene tetrahydromethanopterin reductase-like flavin-dependent oxidoreductase (luciferase family)
LAAWDAVALLVAMAGETQRAHLSAYVLNATLRNTLLLASQLAVAQAASGGRIEVGLGAGGLTHLAGYGHRAAAVDPLTAPQRAARLEAACTAIPALWRGETVSDPRVGLFDACIGPLDVPPAPITVGGTSRQIMRIAAHVADGWNATGVSGPQHYERLRARMDRLCAGAGRRRPLRYSVQLFARELAAGHERSTIAAYAVAGATEIVLALDRGTSPDDIRRLAEAVL